MEADHGERCTAERADQDARQQLRPNVRTERGVDVLDQAMAAIKYVGGTQIGRREMSTTALASSAAPATFDGLLAHLFASRFAHPAVYRLLRRRFPMMLAGGIDRSPVEAVSRDRCLSRRLW
jgi:hypothetical protein